MKNKLLNITLDFPINEHTVQRVNFSDPLKIISTTKADNFNDCLEDIEIEQKNGNYVVGFISYDTNITSYLLCFGVYDKPQITNSSTQYKELKLNNKWVLSESLSQYRKKINQIKEHIKNGDCYQVNYTIRAYNQLITGNPKDLYKRLVDCQCAKYSAYIEHKDFTILSFSPELFFKQTNRFIETKPMKGTRPLVLSENLDNQINVLKQSKKDQSENVMIVDLLRNDLSKISTIGSVKTSQLFAIEPYQDVLQMTSTITSELKEEITFKNVVTSLFPCGSITGAPKKKVMEIINDLEDEPRGAYCGAIGILSPDNQCTFNVPIRTIIHNKHDNKLVYGVGSGITWDSKAEEEYEEINNKINFLHQDIPISLFETIYLHNGKCLLWDYHFSRLLRSAKELGFILPNDVHYKSINDLDKLTKEGDFRAKFIYHRNGVARWEYYPVPTTPIMPVVQLADSSINSNDFRILHKTTDRSVYDSLFTEQNSSCFDLILWNEKEEITEFTRGNLVIEIDQKLYTPSSDSGLLPGILRQVLLENNIIFERKIDKTDIYQAKNIWFINSLRGWVKVIFKDS